MGDEWAERGKREVEEEEKMEGHGLEQEVEASKAARLRNIEDLEARGMEQEASSYADAAAGAVKKEEAASDLPDADYDEDPGDAEGRGRRSNSSSSSQGHWPAAVEQWGRDAEPLFPGEQQPMPAQAAWPLHAAVGYPKLSGAQRKKAWREQKRQKREAEKGKGKGKGAAGSGGSPRYDMPPMHMHPAGLVAASPGRIYANSVEWAAYTPIAARQGDGGTPATQTTASTPTPAAASVAGGRAGAGRGDAAQRASSFIDRSEHNVCTSCKSCTTLKRCRAASS